MKKYFCPLVVCGADVAWRLVLLDYLEVRL